MAAASQQRDAKAEREAQEWIEAVTGKEFQQETYEDSLRDGVMLCRGKTSHPYHFGQFIQNALIRIKTRRLINKLRPKSVPKISLSKTSKFKQMENVSNYLKAARAFGVNEFEMFSTPDLYDKKNIAGVTLHIHALGRTVRQKMPEWDGPQLGLKMATKNKREFTEEQLAKARGQPTLLSMGSTAASRVAFAKALNVYDEDEDEEGEAEDGAAPAEPAAAAAAVKEEEEAASPAAASPAASESGGGGEDELPPGWSAYQDGDGDTYYGHEDGRTQWDRPVAEAGAEAPAPAPEDAAEDALPAGWTAYQDGDGDTYYGHEDGRTQWDKPTE